MLLLLCLDDILLLDQDLLKEGINKCFCQEQIVVSKVSRGLGRGRFLRFINILRLLCFLASFFAVNRNTL